MARTRSDRLLCALLLLSLLTIALSPIPDPRFLRLMAWLPLRCPLTLFHLRCPTCGLGHGLYFAARGEWRLAESFHPLSVPLYLALIGLSILNLVSPTSAADLSFFLVRERRRKPFLWWLLVASYAIFGVVRNF